MSEEKWGEVRASSGDGRARVVVLQWWTWGLWFFVLVVVVCKYGQLSDRFGVKCICTPAVDTTW